MTTPIGRSGLARVSGTGFDAPSVRMASPGVVATFDDFLGDVIADQWNYTEGTDSATSASAILAGGVGGVLRMTTGDTGTGLAADLCQLSQELQWRAANGGLFAEARVKLSAITNAYVFFGFTDVGTLEAPVESAASANTLTSNATNAAGLMFDTRMTSDNFWLVGVKADVDPTAQDSGVAPVADDYITLGVAVDVLGTATFFVNGAPVGTPVANAVAPAAMMTPTLAVSKTSVAASMNLDVDYIGVSMNRAANGDAY